MIQYYKMKSYDTSFINNHSDIYHASLSKVGQCILASLIMEISSPGSVSEANLMFKILSYMNHES